MSKGKNLRQKKKLTTKKLKIMAYVNNLKELKGIKVTTKYYIDFVYEYDSNKNIICSYYQLVRTSDDAILYANADFNYVYAECFVLGINNSEVTIF